MREKYIYMQLWLDMHRRVKIEDTDHWYLDLANKLLPVVNSCGLYSEQSDETLGQLSLTLALYLEDCVADAGNWRQFIHWHKANYGCYLPFYTLTDDYLADEINEKDIALLLWGLGSPVGDFYGVKNPMDEELLNFANVVYQLLDDAFEEAPISRYLAEDWFLEVELMKKERTIVPDALLNEETPINVKRFLEINEGKALMYFDSYAKLASFFIHTFAWEGEEESFLPELQEFQNFVLYANSKGFLIGVDIAAYFADERNPLYNKEQSEEEAYELFCEQGVCPFDLLKYGVEHHLFPDAQLPFEDGKRFLHENWDFLSRWFLGEYYEGN